MSFPKGKLVKLLDPQWFRDFFAFKLNVFPAIVRFIYILCVLFFIICGIQYMTAGRVWGGIFVIIFGPLVSHIVIEFFLLLFVIVDLLREIRDKIVEK